MSIQLKIYFNLLKNSEQDPSLSMENSDEHSLFMNIPLNISVNQLFENTDTVKGASKSEL